MRKWFVLLFIIFFSVQSQAFTCFLTIIKDSCWDNYTVEVTAKDAASNNIATKVTVPADKTWAREQFTCQPKESLVLTATFSPVFWESDANTVYQAVKNWAMPDEIKKDEKAWNITVCYPQQFEGVPLPPDAKGNCTCNTDQVPPISPM